MKITAQEIYDKLINEDKILTLEGQIKFELGDVNIIVKQKDVVGNIMQEWLEGWLKKKGYDYAPSTNTQMPPDFYLDPDDKTKELLEVKAFNYDATPGFDIAAFSAFQKEIVEKPYMLHAKYLIFGYKMSDTGVVTVKKVWLKNVWEICRPMEKWALNLQVKEKVVHKIRPAKWYSSSRSNFSCFESLEDFLSAVDDVVYQNPDTRAFAPEWKGNIIEAYHQFYDKELSIPRWYEIKQRYVKPKTPKTAKKTKK